MGAHRRVSKGTLSFAAWVERQPSQAAAARLLGVGQQYVSKVKRGERIPTEWSVVERFRDVAGIDPADWKPTRSKAAAARTRAA